MSIFEVKDKDGIIHNANEGEALRGKELFCIYCDARMHLAKFKSSDDFYFELDNAEDFHPENLPCFEQAGYVRIRPTFKKNQTPDSFIDGLMKPVKKRNQTNNNTNGKSSDVNNKNTNKTVTAKHRFINNIPELVESRIYEQRAFDFISPDSNQRNINFVVFSPVWARLLWKNEDLVELGKRVVEVKPLNTRTNGNLSLKNDVDEDMDENKTIWFEMFFKDNNKKRKHIKFALKCVNGSYANVIKKIFEQYINDKGAIDLCHFKGKYVDSTILIGAEWRPMEKSECKKNCPYKDQYWNCKHCLGAYIAICINQKQIYIFSRTKEREKDEKNKK